mmetsp:Transcript_22993/g.86961  ORF Transcript_22993/g.86961 Transcript_22993/m.86961 type:complete len:415 (-) Transcript_22993:46-1290(-)
MRACQTNNSCAVAGQQPLLDGWAFAPLGLDAVCEHRLHRRGAEACGDLAHAPPRLGPPGLGPGAVDGGARGRSGLGSVARGNVARAVVQHQRPAAEPGGRLHFGSAHHRPGNGRLRSQQHRSGHRVGARIGRLAALLQPRQHELGSVAQHLRRRAVGRPEPVAAAAPVDGQGRVQGSLPRDHLHGPAPRGQERVLVAGRERLAAHAPPQGLRAQGRGCGLGVGREVVLQRGAEVTGHAARSPHHHCAPQQPRKPRVQEARHSNVCERPEREQLQPALVLLRQPPQRRRGGLRARHGHGRGCWRPLGAGPAEPVFAVPVAGVLVVSHQRARGSRKDGNRLGLGAARGKHRLDVEKYLVRRHVACHARDGRHHQLAGAGFRGQHNCDNGLRVVHARIHVQHANARALRRVTVCCHR